LDTVITSLLTNLLTQIHLRSSDKSVVIWMDSFDYHWHT